MHEITRVLNFASIHKAFAGLLVSMAAASTIAGPSLLWAQNEVVSSTAAAASVPRLIRFNGVLTDGRGWPITTPVNVLFGIYSQPDGEGEPLWQETQQISPNDKGGYSVLLGSANPIGVPIEIFKSGESQYLSMKPEGEPEERRVLLVSVPYALKAADSATLGGLPASAFVLAGTNAARNAVVVLPISPDVASTVTTTGGTANKLAKFSGSSTIVNSILYDNGTEIGIGTTAPTATLTVDGTMAVAGDSTYNGSLVLPAMGTATATTAYNSQPIKLYTSAYNSSTKAVVSPHFQWQAVPKSNDTAAPTATLNLLSSTSNGNAAATGFSFNANGTINFAPGQTFPAGGGTGGGTITGVTAGLGLTGGGATGRVILNVDLTKTPLLATNNTFAGRQIIGANPDPLPAQLQVSGSGGTPTATQNAISAQLGSQSFLGADYPAAVYADGGAATSPTGSQSAFVGTAEDNYAAEFSNFSASPTLLLQNVSPAGYLFEATNPSNSTECVIDNLGDLTCSGTISSTNSTSGARTVTTYGLQEAENWSEDAGSGQLHDGFAHVDLEPTFGATVNTGVAYHVFLTPEGECKGLYVANKTGSGFEVRELGSGRSSVAFDYRIMAKRRGYETVRLEDVTSKMQERAKQRRQVSGHGAHPQTVPSPASSIARLPDIRSDAHPTN